MLKVKALGVHGSSQPGFHLCSFLINESFVLDAGSITEILPLKEQKKIKNILITHSHLDHIKDIAFLADNIQIPRPAPINLVSTKEILDIIKNHFLNDLIWPNFTRLPNPELPILKYKPIPMEHPVMIDDLEIKIVKVKHAVPTVAYFISDGTSTIMFSGDLGPPSNKLWQIANRTENLKAIFIDIAFPNSMKHIADLSKHMTPDYLAKELSKLKKSVAIYGYHIKSRFQREIKKEMSVICPQVNIIKEGEVLTF